MGGREGEVVTSNQSLISNTKAITGSCSLVFRLTESPSWVGGPLLVPYTGLSLRYGFCIDVFPPPPFFEPSQGMGLTTSYKNVVRVSLHLQGFTISPKKAALSATRVGARTMRSGEKVGVDLCEKVVESKVKLT